jgi:hypothetical protein
MVGCAPRSSQETKARNTLKPRASAQICAKLSTMTGAFSPTRSADRTGSEVIRLFSHRAALKSMSPIFMRASGDKAAYGGAADSHCQMACTQGDEIEQITGDGGYACRDEGTGQSRQSDIYS